MYAAGHASADPDRPCIVMASTGETITYGEFDARTNRLAHLLRAHGLRDGDHYSILLENHPRFFEACGAGERAGLRYTAINSHLTAEEVAYILDDSAAKVLITSRQLRDVALEALAGAPGVTLALVVDGDDDGPLRSYVEATAAFPSTPIPDEKLGAPMLYSSGTTGRPKGILRAIPDTTPDKSAALAGFLIQIQRYRPGMVFLSPAPLYHSAPLGATGNTIRVGGTVVVMERFDPEQLLALVERHRVTHTQMVPTMFSRLLKLPDDVKRRYDLSSLEYVVHAAAPCPVPVKEQMIEWWGPIIHEYYASTEGIGYTTCDAHEWLAHKGTVGRAALGVLRILDEDFHECPPGVPGTIYFEPPGKLDYWNAPDKVRDNSTPDGSAITVGDVGFVDEDGWLFLTDRKTFMIISGGVNIYPQETENLLVTHPKVADVAVFGVPNVDLGEEVKAVVQPMPGVEPSPELAAELIAFCAQHLSKQKCPRSIDFEEQLPRLPTGKLYKRLLRDRYWGDKQTRIV
jgi:long-chain acyl-CoA synthetase